MHWNVSTTASPFDLVVKSDVSGQFSSMWGVEYSWNLFSSTVQFPRCLKIISKLGQDVWEFSSFLNISKVYFEFNWCFVLLHFQTLCRWNSVFAEIQCLAELRKVVAKYFISRAQPATAAIDKTSLPRKGDLKPKVVNCICRPGSSSGEK